LLNVVMTAVETPNEPQSWLTIIMNLIASVCCIWFTQWSPSMGGQRPVVVITKKWMTGSIAGMLEW
jgi:hypothetical protein